MAYNIKEYQYAHIAGAATLSCFLGRGNLGGININTATAISPITIADSSSTTALVGTTVALIAAGVPGGNVYLEGISISSGLLILTTGASDITVQWTRA